jgi:DNA-binding GntR family transcriptional regulator
MTLESSKTTPFQIELGKFLGELRRQIFSGLRLPRERLVESDLAKLFSINRMMVRQALLVLETEGLVTIEAYKGASVAEISLLRIFESYQVDAMLEGYAALLATHRLDKKDLLLLRKYLEKLRTLAIEKVQEWQELNYGFHRIINLTCGNQRLIELIRKNSQFTSYWFIVLSSPGRIANSIEEHQAIVDAFAKGQAEEARRLMENHIISAGEYLVEFMRKNVPMGMWRDGK